MSVGFGQNYSFGAGGGSTPFSKIGAASQPAVTALSTVGKAAPAMGMLGKAGGMLAGASSILGPVAMGLQVGNMLYGAWNSGKQARKESAELANKASMIQEQMVNSASNLRDNLTDIDEEFQDKQTDMGEMIGDKLQDAGKNLGQTIQKGRGLMTGDTQIQKQEIMDDMGQYQDSQTKMLETQRGGQYANMVEPHMQNMNNSQQGLLDIASQRKQLASKDSMWENLIS